MDEHRNQARLYLGGVPMIVADSIEFIRHDLMTFGAGVLCFIVIILAVALVFVRWIGAARPAQLLMVGLIWLCLTLVFEVLFGRFVIGASWERLAADYNVLEGGLLPFGMLVLLLSPLLAAKVRGLTS